MKFLFAFVYLTIFFIFTGTVLAHGVLQTLNKTDDKYSIDVTYDSLDININGTTPFNFYLKDARSKQDIPFSSVFVRITQGGALLFAGPVSPRSFGPPSITYMFPKEGQYEISARFQKDDETITEASFPLAVEAFEKKKSDLPVKIAVGTTALILGTLIGFFIPKPHKKK